MKCIKSSSPFKKRKNTKSFNAASQDGQHLFITAIGITTFTMSSVNMGKKLICANELHV